MENLRTVVTLFLLLLLLERITDTTPSNLLANIDIIEHKLCFSDNFLKAYQMVRSTPMMGAYTAQFITIFFDITMKTVSYWLNFKFASEKMD